MLSNKTTTPTTPINQEDPDENEMKDLLRKILMGSEQAMKNDIYLGIDKLTSEGTVYSENLKT
jgi:hypothetical protein